MKTKTKARKKNPPPRCEGWRRRGGMMTLGLPTWEQCKEPGTVMLKFRQDGKVQTLPACAKCWEECRSKDSIEILEAKPIL